MPSMKWSYTHAWYPWPMGSWEREKCEGASHIRAFTVPLSLARPLPKSSLCSVPSVRPILLSYNVCRHTHTTGPDPSVPPSPPPLPPRDDCVPASQPCKFWSTVTSRLCSCMQVRKKRQKNYPWPNKERLKVRQDFEDQVWEGSPLKAEDI